MDIRHPRFTTISTTLLVALAYFAAGRLGLLLPGSGSNITLIWLPTGIAVAALLRWGFGCWPGISLGALAVNLAISRSWPLALGIAAGNTLGPLLAAWTLRRMRFHPAFDRARDILQLAAASMLGMAVTSGLGVTTLVSAGVLSPSARVQAWFNWWAGDTLGVIATAPLLLTFTWAEARAIQRRWVEFVSWVGATSLVTWAVFVANNGTQGEALALAFVPLPFVAWAALRFGPVGTSLGMILLSLGAAYGTAVHRGPFYRTDAREEVTMLWLYMATSATLGWLISALHSARVQATGVQRLFERALSDVSLGVILAGLDRRITYVNQGFTRLTGYADGELLGKSCALLQGPETDPATSERLKTAVFGDGFFDGEILNYRKDGTTFWNGLLISPVRDERGAMTGFLGIQRDITKRKRAEIALHDSEERLRTIIELEPECVKIVSPDGKLLEMNPAGLAMIEAASIEEVRGCLLTELIALEDRAAFAEMHRRALQGATDRCEFAIVGLKGTRRWLETHAVPYRDARREIVGVLGITRDITARKEAAAELERSLSTLQLFINSVPAHISFVDTEERYRLVNKRYEEYFGRPAESLLGQRLCDLQPPAAYAEIQPHVRAALAGQNVRYQSHLTAPDGRSYWFDAQYVPRRNDDGTVTGFFVLVFDITQNKQAEAALQRSEAQFRTLADNLPDVVARFDRNRRHLYINAAVESATGLKPEVFAGKTNEELGMPAENVAIWKAMLEKVFSTGSSERLEFSYPGPAGENFWESLVVSERGASGDVESALVLSRDITERKRLEQEREQYFKFFQLSTDPMCIADPFGCFKRINPAFMKLTGFSENELVTRPFMDFVLPEDRERTAEEMKLQVAVRPSMQFENRYVCKDGSVIVLSWMAYFDKVDGVTYATARDVTKMKQAEAALRDSEFRWKFAIEGSGDGLWDWDVPEGRVFFSRHWKDMLGFAEDEIGDRLSEWESRVHPDDKTRVMADTHAHFDGKTPHYVNEHRIRCKDGSWKWFLSRGLVVSRDAEGKPLRIIGTHTDITERRQAQIEREALDRKVQETQKLESLGVLAGGIAHDFNNLLTSILGNASIAAMDLPPGSPVQDCIEQINEASLRAADLCKQMLAYSGRGRFIVQKLDLGQLVEQTAQMLQISISKKAVLRFHLEKGLPPIEVDATQIRQVIMNLVINASEAIGDQSGVISLSTGLTRVDRNYLHGTLMDPDLPEGDYVFLEVSDSGCGMSAETQARIFDPFFTTKFTGRGLGLAAVLGIVRGHKGAMKVYSELGRGTTFKLLFPAASGTCETTSPAPARGTDWQGKGTVLVVDDEETMRTTVARMMRIIGLEPVLVADGREAVEVFRADPARFALVLLDLTMPHMDGEQTFTELRRLRTDVRVVLMSGFNAQEALLRFPGKGLASFLQKPFTITALSAILKEVLDAKETT